jgi:exodeoxyribonuclease VII large subunit
MSKKEITIYTVSQLTTLIKTTLENNLPGRLTVKGEISGWKGPHANGHCYFSLKDENAVLPCVMWSDKFKQVKFKPENGLAVFGTGHISVFVPQGRLQFYIESMEPAGVGTLQLAFEQMRKRLEAEGLFDEKHKRPLPKYPMRIGILTSESGAALFDIKDSIHNRWPCAKLFLYPVPVQGEGAAEEIASALRYVNRQNNKLKLDVLIVGRGGGSLEDLWAFNEEVLARAIFASKIPVISAVGHEVDVTIADLVADKRASTPTKAGVVGVPDYKEVLKQLSLVKSQLTGEIESVIELAQQKMETLLASAAFRNPLLPVRNRQQRLDEMEGNLSELLTVSIATAKEKLREIYEKVIRIEPHRLLGKKAVELNEIRNRSAKAITAIVLNRQQRVDELTMKMKVSVRQFFAEARELLRKNLELIVRIEPHRLLGKKAIGLNELKNRSAKALSVIVHKLSIKLTAQENKLFALNPKSVLNRGYSITKNKKTGLLIRKADDVEIGDIIITELAEKNLIESKTIKK